MAKKVKTNNKKKMDVAELTAYRRAYGDDLGRKEYVAYVVMPALLFLFFSTILLYNPIVSVVMFVVGLLYGWRYFLPKSIQKTYEQKAFSQRNKFLNNMTQILTDESKTVSKGLATAKIRASGEFRDDLTRLEAQLFGADVTQIQDAIQEVIDKYDDDIIFIQYMEQIETSAIEGRTNIGTLKDIKLYHNQMKSKQEEYEKQKQAHVSDMKMMMITITIFILALTFSFGFEMYYTAFATALPGYIASGIYITLMMVFFKQFSTYLFDDSVTSINK